MQLVSEVYLLHTILFFKKYFFSIKIVIALINIILKNKVNFYLQRSGSDDVRGKKRKKLFK